tara:strand:+ start:596 stop:832 length:237 start_codon:yes stop_codon:yes gene_type:complete
MGQCMTKTSVLVEDVYRSASESVSEIQRKISARNYTPVTQQETTILSNYEDKPVEDNLTVGEQEIEDIFKDSELDDKI